MSSQFRVNRVLFFQTAFALLMLVSPWFAQGEEGSAVNTVSEFYSLHFARADRMYFSPENIRSKRKWLTPGLYRLMLYEFRREREYMKANADQALKPYFPEMFLPTPNHCRRSLGSQSRSRMGIGPGSQWSSIGMTTLSGR